MRLRSVRVLLLVASFLIFVLNGLAEPHGGAVMFLQQQKSAAAFVSTTHGKMDWLVSAELKNQSSKTIAAYQVGWIYFDEQKSPPVHYGQWVNVPTGISPLQTALVPAQHAAPNLGASCTLFFISEVKFTDGSTWKEDSGQITRSACPHTTQN